MNCLVVDLGVGNLGSLRRALEDCGATVTVSSDPEEISRCSAIVLPGVGAFSAAMEILEQRGWLEPLAQAVARDGVPLLGICLGMQLLADRGTEGGNLDGLRLIPGSVERMVPTRQDVRVPHVGWNEVHQVRPSEPFAGIPDRADFYFVHSYVFNPENEEDVIATSPYCGEFPSALARGHIWGFQFHPEKSSRHGRVLLRNFLECASC